jgi:hypothetical protein
MAMESKLGDHLVIPLLTTQHAGTKILAFGFGIASITTSLTTPSHIAFVASSFSTIQTTTL